MSDWLLAVLPIQSCELADVRCCKEAGSLGKLGVGYLRKYVCLGGLKRRTSGIELWTKFYLKGWSLSNFMFIE